MNGAEQAADEISLGLDMLHADARTAGTTIKTRLDAALAANGDALSAKELALLKLTFAAAGGCEACTRRHVLAVAKAGGGHDEVAAALRQAVLLADGPATPVAADALATFDAITGKSRADAKTAPERPKPPRPVDFEDSRTGRRPPVSAFARRPRIVPAPTARSDYILARTQPR